MLLLVLLLSCAGVCNAIKVSLHIYLAISFVIIFDISNVFLPLCVSFKWSPQTHTHTQTHTETALYTNEFIGFLANFKLLRDFKNLPALCLRTNFAWKIKKAAGGMWQAAGGSCQAGCCCSSSRQWQVSSGVGVVGGGFPSSRIFVWLLPTALRMHELAPKCRWVVWTNDWTMDASY